MRSLFLLQNTNTALENGSRLKLVCTIVIRPFILFLISVAPQLKYSNLLSKLSIASLTFGTLRIKVLSLYLNLLSHGFCLFRFGLFRSLYPLTLLLLLPNLAAVILAMPDCPVPCFLLPPTLPLHGACAANNGTRFGVYHLVHSTPLCSFRLSLGLAVFVTNG